MILLALSLSAFGAPESVTLGWAPSQDPTVVGYTISYGGQSGDYTNTIDVGTNMSYTLSGLTPGSTYYFVTTSYNAYGIQSAPTAEVSYVAPLPSVPSLSGLSVNSGTVSLQFQVVPSTSYQLQASSDLVNWSSVWSFDSGTTNGVVQFDEPFDTSATAKFYRLVSQ
jgi:hypothetical protein